MEKLTEAFEVHQELNPKIWDTNNNLLPDVRDKILEIVEEFKANVKDMSGLDINPVDIHLLGSNASYNYTDHSDLDIHLVVNFDMIDTNEDLVQALFNLQKSEFNKSYDISIHGVDVELYVEDIKANTVSNGIYSVTNDMWIKEPEPLTDIPEVDIEDELDDWKVDINKALDSKSINDISNIINELYLLRKNGLATTGEYGEQNQLFKEIRNLGLLDELKDQYMKLKSKELSLENRRKETKCMSRFDEVKEPYYGYSPADDPYDLWYEREYGSSRYVELESAQELAQIMLRDDKDLKKVIKDFLAENSVTLDDVYDSDLENQLYFVIEDYIGDPSDWDNDRGSIPDGYDEYYHCFYYDSKGRTYVIEAKEMSGLADWICDELFNLDTF